MVDTRYVGEIIDAILTIFKDKGILTELQVDSIRKDNKISAYYSLPLSSIAEE